MRSRASRIGRIVSMRVTRRSIVTLLAAFVALRTGGLVHAQEPTRAESDAMQAKLERVATAAETPRPAGAPPLRTTFAEREINAYLALEGPDFLPAGIAMPRVQLGDAGRVRARAI